MALPSLPPGVDREQLHHQHDHRHQHAEGAEHHARHGGAAEACDQRRQRRRDDRHGGTDQRVEAGHGRLGARDPVPARPHQIDVVRRAQTFAATDAQGHARVVALAVAGQSLAVQGPAFRRRKPSGGIQPGQFGQRGQGDLFHLGAGLAKRRQRTLEGVEARARGMDIDVHDHDARGRSGRHCDVRLRPASPPLRDSAEIGGGVKEPATSQRLLAQRDTRKDRDTGPGEMACSSTNVGCVGKAGEQFRRPRRDGSDSLSWPHHDGASSSQCRNTVVGGRSVASRSSGLTQPRLRRGRSLSWT